MSGVPAPRQPEGMRRRERTAGLALALVCYAPAAALCLLGRHLTGATIAFDAPVLLLLLLLQVFGPLPRRRAARPRHWVLLLTAQAVITYLPVLVADGRGVDVPGFLAGSILLWLPRPLSFAAWAGAVLLDTGIEVLRGSGTGAVVAYGVGAVVSSLAVAALGRLLRLVAGLRLDAAEAARAAVREERRRTSRDLHDLLGYSLSAITLRGELALRLVESSPERTRAEITSVLSLARGTLTDVRTLSHHYRAMSLESEARAVHALLASAGVATTVSLHCGRLTSRVDTVLATVLREGVANVLRHSRARTCTLEATVNDGTVRLVVRNDGVRTAGSRRRDGTGLDNLAVRLDELGGTLSHRTDRGGWFVVEARVPAGPCRAPGPAVPRECHASPECGTLGCRTGHGDQSRAAAG
ncbi:sensor histidine kinase [Streptomyces sp. NPDC101133]|uniref:sensor histidine kinase n=1 Tax=Streptomyces sp. NPDC101133 TaxID=3366111 RepID=UPI003829067D